MITTEGHRDLSSRSVEPVVTRVEFQLLTPRGNRLTRASLNYLFKILNTVSTLTVRFVHIRGGIERI